MSHAAHVDFDALSRKTFVDGDTAARDELWRSLFKLDEWLFIARGPQHDQPYVCSNAAVAENKAMLKAFTDSEKLNRFARANNLVESTGDVLFLSLKFNVGLLAHLEKYGAQGVHGIHFNADLESDGFFAPLVQLKPIYDYLAKQSPQKNS